MSFEPIAIIARSCVLPLVNSPEQLWQASITKKDCLSEVTAADWLIDPSHFSAKAQGDVSNSFRAGYVKDFEQIKNFDDLMLDKIQILQQATITQWLIHCAKTAWCDTGYDISELSTRQRGGIIMGNLSYPTRCLNQFAQAAWLCQQPQGSISVAMREQAQAYIATNANHRFMSGYPLHVVAQALNLPAMTYAIDAACASSLYALKLACDELQYRRADIMFSGGVNCSDDLFLHVGFSALQALSKSGHSRPLQANADGLVPGQGVAMLVLKRLTDAIKANDTIHGVIRGIGLSNDGSTQGFLAPDMGGQVVAMQRAYEQSGLCPSDVSWVDCHATGTAVGDSIEVNSMREIFAEHKALAIGALKANIGHTVTASGGAALINTLSAFNAEQLPPTRGANQKNIAALDNTPFRLLEEVEAWENKPYLAAINSFGFGGNNAHLLVQAYQADKLMSYPKSTKKAAVDLAIVALEVNAAGVNNVADLSRILAAQQVQHNNGFAVIEDIELPIAELRFPPNDLRHTLAQQLVLLKLMNQMMQQLDGVDSNKTSVFIGMQCDGEISRYALKWRLPAIFPQADAKWLAQAEAEIVASLPSEKLTSADAIGCMPNIVANRLNNQFDVKGASFSVSGEALSASRTLHIAMDALHQGEIDNAIVGAVDLCAEPVQKTAIEQLQGKTIAGDAAVVFMVKRLSDAHAAKDTIYAIIPAQEKAAMALGTELPECLWGDTGAATSALQLACAIMHCSEFTKPHPLSLQTIPWLAKHQQLAVQTQAIGQQQASVRLSKPACALKKTEQLPEVHCYHGQSHQQLRDNIDQHELGQGGMALSFVAEDAQRYQQKRQLAMQWLVNPDTPLPPGIYFSAQPLGGKTAFVFTGSTTTYANMGKTLALQFPNYVAELNLDDGLYQQLNQQLYINSDTKQLSSFDELKTFSFLAQLHAKITQQALAIHPDACIGYCSGESNALLAMGAWQDINQFYQAIDDSRFYQDKLMGAYSVLPAQYSQQTPAWVSWRVFATREMVSEIVEGIDKVWLTIINAPNDCIIAGSPESCDAVIQKLPTAKARRLPDTMVLHCEAFLPYADEWRAIHRRETHRQPNVQFYSTGSGKSYQATADAAAEALVSQASAQVDFPRVITNAWNDGVRVFIEHGPRDLCSKWIGQILADKPHLVIPMDRKGVDNLVQLANVSAALQVAGVNHNTALFRR